MILALINKQIDGAFEDEIALNYWSQQNSGVFKKLGKPIFIGSGFGIMSIPNNMFLIESINKILTQMENDGTYIQIYNKYFFN